MSYLDPMNPMPPRPTSDRYRNTIRQSERTSRLATYAWLGMIALLGGLALLSAFA